MNTDEVWPYDKVCVFLNIAPEDIDTTIEDINEGARNIGMAPPMKRVERNGERMMQVDGGFLAALRKLKGL